MTQSGIVTALLPNDMASVSVERQTACGGNCASCGGCSYKNVLTAVAENSFGAKVGDKVTLRSRTKGVIGAAALVYLLPIVTFLIGYAVAAAFGAKEGTEILVSVICLLLGCGAAAWIGRKRKDRIRFEIISIDS
ncbi:MAG: SoxR reducing system RseC family protein [Oscillospiraceae bacterium]|nr:SoxR reducing system RseC family protein [Oscillospiraceae bacterium]